MMKKKLNHLLFLFAFVGTLNCVAQVSFEKYMEMDNVTALEVMPEMMDLVSAVDIRELAEDEKEASILAIVKKMDKIRMVSSQDQAKKDLIIGDFQAFVEQNKLEKFVEMNDQTSLMKIYVKPDKAQESIEKFVLLMGGNRSIAGSSTMLLILDGKISNEDKKTLAKRMNITKNEEVSAQIERP